MFTSNCGFFHCGQASRQAYQTGPQKATICSVTQQQKSQNRGKATILPQSKWTCEQTKCDWKPQTTMEVTNLLLS